MDHVLKEINDLMEFYSVGMEGARRNKNYQKYDQFLEAFEALSILKERLNLNEKVA